METIVERLKKYIDYKGIAISVAERVIGVSNATLSKPFNSNTTIKTDTLEKFLFHYTDINPEWLLYGKGSMFKNSSQKNTANTDILLENLKENNELLKFKIRTLEKDLEKRETSRSEPILYSSVAEPKP